MTSSFSIVQLSEFTGKRAFRTSQESPECSMLTGADESEPGVNNSHILQIFIDRYAMERGNGTDSRFIIFKWVLDTRIEHKLPLFIYAAALLLMILLSSCSTGTARIEEYRSKLIRGAVYDPAVTAHISDQLQFSYTPPSDPDLTALRERIEQESGLNLDRRSRVDEDNETALIIDLISYVHRLVPWDGSAPWPEGILSTENILAFAEDQGIGVNCRMKAIILQEAYLSAGLPARIVSCIPMDPNDRDSHVIVTVWAETLGKWVWADPSFNAYVTDENGTLAGIREVREGLIAGRRFFLNDDARIRSETLDPVFYFDYYMTKNLYGFISPLEAAYGYEGSPGERYCLMLVPACELPRMGSNETEPFVQHYQFRESSFTRFIVSDPDLFWSPPQ